MWPRHDIIRAEAFCTICGQRYDFTNLQVLEEEHGSPLLYIRCQQCQTGSLSTISMGQGKFKLITMATDLTEDEVMRFREEDGLTDDDVLKMHAVLSTSDDFIESI
jgi:hypothetical protein